MSNIPTKRPSQTRARKGQADIKTNITKKQFERILVKVFVQPISGKLMEDAKEVKQTSASHPSDGCTETRKNQDKTEGKED